MNYELLIGCVEYAHFCKPGHTSVKIGWIAIHAYVAILIIEIMITLSEYTW